MSESVFSSGMRGAIPGAVEDPGRAITLVPGLNGTVRLYHADRAVHIDHNALRDLLVLRDTAVIYDASGTAIRLPSELRYIVPRPALVDAARGLTRSRFDPMPSV
ncbi:hypothetical protein [Methanosphaerula palustris]|uniref:Uncharacterized protein n=1 Tax=Methanosphaerula palustris (strain ATCC BAA-1556 / DSM 19958 / E1-9c) TaxID=521011 RepID=B8GHX5_METPE|nr:hypothetical protein [Methanosphaerula palustris]ACL16715.1 hypothetical protein Mpal_1385 [Methanosphaerula palustris E1-9c]